jgi:phosphoribosylaminoimidazole-succinocarboxamide synthase
MNPYIIIACLVASIGAGAGGFKLGADHEVAAQAREQSHIAEAVDAANNASAQAIAKIKVINQTIQNEVQREVQNNIVYRDCKHSPDGMRLLNQALTGDKPTGDGKLPKADATGR